MSATGVFNLSSKTLFSLETSEGKSFINTIS